MILELWEGGVPIRYIDSTHSFASNLKLSNGSVEEVNINESSPLPLTTVQKYTADIATGLYYLKTRGIIHRDIKPGNLLTNSEGRCCISDFGSAKLITGENLISGIVTDTEGTLAFFPPEACEGGPYNGYQADVWALGVTLYAFIFLKLPFDTTDGNASALFASITGDEVSIPDSIDIHLKDLLRKLLTKDAAKRITIEDVMRHKWIEPFVDEDKRLI